VIDFRYAPAESWTLICQPDDWLKSAVTSSGALAYDFGPGPYARPLTTITVRVREESLRVRRQWFPEARVPLLATLLSGPTTTAEQHAFALIPDHSGPHATTWKSGTVRRSGGLNGCIGWAQPPDSVDGAFRNAAWGTNRPIRYAVRIPRGAARRVALGVIEPYKWGPGARLLELRVEGASPRIVDPMGDNIRNRPHVFLFDGRDIDKDGWLTIESHAPEGAPDPNVTLSGFWVFPPGTAVDTASVISGRANASAEVFHRCGTELEEESPGFRMDALVSKFSEVVTPVLAVRTRRALVYDKTRRQLVFEGRPYLLTSPAPAAAERTVDGWELSFDRGTRTVHAVVVHGGQGAKEIIDFPDLDRARESVEHAWRRNATIATRRITVPDTTLQYVIDVNVRNLYQVREIVDGLPQMQPGPSVYRGLWLADVVLEGMTFLTLGDTATMRLSLEGGLRHQLPSGQLRSLYPTVSLLENPVFVYAACLYAQSSGNRAWLKAHWPAMRAAIRWILAMRDSTLRDPSSLSYGLLPPGFVDGGLSTPTTDFGAVWWAMTMLDRGADAARWLGFDDDAREWRAAFNAFEKSFAHAARKSFLRDPHGNLFLPVGVGDTSVTAPQRGQYALLWGVRSSPFQRVPGTLADSIIAMNLRMLDSYTSQGMVAGSGWLKDATWPWLGGIQGIAWLFQGNHRRALDMLYAYANHASTAGTWAEEQLPNAMGSRTSGDLADGEASAVFLSLARLLLATDDVDTLHLLRGMPAAWLAAGAETRLDGILTEYGFFSLSVRVSPDGQEARLAVTPPRGGRPLARIATDLRAFTQAGFHGDNRRRLPAFMDLSLDHPTEIVLHRIAP
jgi:hypothetical protein